MQKNSFWVVWILCIWGINLLLAIWFANVCTHSGGFPVILMFSLCRSFLVWCSPICLFLLLFPLPLVGFTGNITKYNVNDILLCLCFLPRILWFQVSGIQVFIPFELISCMMSDSGLVLFFCIWMSNLPNTIYGRDCPFPSCICFFARYHKLITHLCVGLFLGSQFCSIDLCIYFCASINLLWLLYICNKLCYKCIVIKSGNMILPALFFLKAFLVSLGFFWSFHTVF